MCWMISKDTVDVDIFGRVMSSAQSDRLTYMYSAVGGGARSFGTSTFIAAGGWTTSGGLAASLAWAVSGCLYLLHVRGMSGSGTRRVDLYYTRRGGRVVTIWKEGEGGPGVAAALAASSVPP
jgi:hypothetical protein